MKKLLFIFVTSLLIGCGTDQGKGKSYKYTIKNDSGKNITINSFRTFYPKRITPLITSLNNGESITKTFDDTLPPSGYDFTVFFNGDSLVINYNNEKKQVYTMFKGVDEVKGPFAKAGTIENFVFSEEDYANSIPCNGNCN
jgi:hypothetical protein